MEGEKTGGFVLEVLPQRFFYHGESDLVPRDVFFRKKTYLAAFATGLDMAVEQTCAKHDINLADIADIKQRIRGDNFNPGPGNIKTLFVNKTDADFSRNIYEII